MNPMDFEQFLEQAPVGVYRTGRDGQIEYANRALAELLGYSDVAAVKEAESPHFYVDVDDRRRWQEALEAAPSGKLVGFRTKWRRVGGEKIEVVNSARAIRVRGVLTGYEGVVTPVMTADVEPINAIGGLLGQLTDEDKDKLSICISRKDVNRRIIWANKAYCHLEGVSLDELLTIKNTDEVLYGEQLDNIYKISDEIVFKSGNPYTTTEKHRSGDGILRNVQVVKVPLVRHQQVYGVEIFFWDAADPLKPMEELEKAKETAERFKQLLRFQYNAVYEHNLRGIITKANPAAFRLTGQQDLIGMHISQIVASDFIDFVEKRIREKLNSSNPAEHITSYELDLLSVDGRRVPVEVTSRLTIDQGRPTGVLSYVRDLTERREAELTKLREIHHRVKNNLHTIGVLLANESRRSEHEQTRHVLTACRARVLVMSQLHEQLYRASQLDRIDVASYLQELAQRLIKTYARPGQHITPRVSVPTDITLSLDTLIPCALVIHELVSNSMKHAFPPKTDGTDRHGAILVNLSCRAPGNYKLSVTDTGIGLPNDFNPRKTRSLGMRLVYGLLEKQLSGVIELDSNSSGTSFSATFKDPYRSA